MEPVQRQLARQLVKGPSVQTIRYKKFEGGSAVVQRPQKGRMQ